MRYVALFHTSSNKNRCESDTNSEIETDYNNGQYHIDIWTGSSTTNGGDDQINCEDALTPNDSQTVVRQPDSDLPVQSRSTAGKI